MLCPFVQSPMYCNFPSFNNTAIVQKTGNSLRETSLYKVFNIFPFSNACQYPFDQNATALPTFTCFQGWNYLSYLLSWSIVSCHQALLVCPFLCQTIGIVKGFTLLYWQTSTSRLLCRIYLYFVLVFVFENWISEVFHFVIQADFNLCIRNELYNGST